MALDMNKDITHVVATSGVFTVTLSDVDGCQAGMKADIGGMPTASWNVNAVTLTAVDTAAKTVSYSHGNFTVASQNVTIAQFHLECSWVDDAYVAVMLGFTPTGSDAAYLTTCVDAANDFAFIRRQAAGYVDHPNIAPGSNVKLGTGLYAQTLFRERGSVDSFASFESAPTPGYGTMGQINKLLGIGRSQVA